MRKFWGTSLNIIFLTVVMVIAFAVSTIALTKKVNEYRAQFEHEIKGTVIKEEVPVMSFNRGIVKKIYVRIGDQVKKNELLAEIENPVLVGRIKALEEYPDNVSAQTEAKVAREQLKGLKIYAPVNGVVTSVVGTEGSPIDELAKVMMLYSNDTIYLLANLNDNQYKKVQEINTVRAYSSRLNQNFLIKPDILRPDQAFDQNQEKKIGLYFIFADPNEAMSLLNNEDLALNLSGRENKITKPIDFFVDFWNSILGIDRK